eukprot:gi/632954627/ref/XP_007893062.1/ PREDICTED: protein ripply2-like [Callorhinchus milii]
MRVWRPWIATPSDTQQMWAEGVNIPSPQRKPGEDGTVVFQHPVRLLWPQSRCFDYLYEDAERLLQNLPVQATISLYPEDSVESTSRIQCGVKYD